MSASTSSSWGSGSGKASRGTGRATISLLKKIFGRGAAPVLYDESFFRPGWFEGWEVLKPVLFELIATEPGWRSILDFGCGPGVMIDYMNERGYDYVGCDYSAEARSIYLERFGRYPDKYVASLKRCAGKSFDVLIAFDVFEHLSDEEISRLLEETSSIPDLFLNISRAKKIPGHINIKSDRKWVRFFERQGLNYLEGKTTEIRDKYSRLRPGTPDKWNENMFVLSRRQSGRH